MKKTLFFSGVILIIILGLFIVFNVSKKSSNKLSSQSAKIKIVTTLFPLYDFAKTIGGNRVEVSLLLPPGVEAHTYEPKPSDIVKNSGSGYFYLHW